MREPSTAGRGEITGQLSSPGEGFELSLLKREAQDFESVGRFELWMRMLLYPISGWPHHTFVASPLVADISKNKQETEEMRFLTYGHDCFNADSYPPVRQLSTLTGTLPNWR